MANKKATGKIKRSCKTSLTETPAHDKSAQPWLQAAGTARLKIEEHKKKIRVLEEAARTFEEYAKEGEAWPQGATR